MRFVLIPLVGFIRIFDYQEADTRICLAKTGSTGGVKKQGDAGEACPEERMEFS